MEVECVTVEDETRLTQLRFDAAVKVIKSLPPDGESDNGQHVPFRPVKSVHRRAWPRGPVRFHADVARCSATARSGLDPARLKRLNPLTYNEQTSLSAACNLVHYHNSYLWIPCCTGATRLFVLLIKVMSLQVLFSRPMIWCSSSTVTTNKPLWEHAIYPDLASGMQLAKQNGNVVATYVPLNNMFLTGDGRSASCLNATGKKCEINYGQLTGTVFGVCLLLVADSRSGYVR